MPKSDDKGGRHESSDLLRRFFLKYERHTRFESGSTMVRTRLLTSESYWRVNCSAHFVTSPCSARFTSTLKSIHWSGRTGLIGIQLPCMTGLYISPSFREWRSAGLLRVRTRRTDPLLNGPEIGNRVERYSSRPECRNSRRLVLEQRLCKTENAGGTPALPGGTTRDAALKWESDQAERGKSTRRG